jgi:hypothetical protein
MDGRGKGRGRSSRPGDHGSGHGFVTTRDIRPLLIQDLLVEEGASIDEPDWDRWEGWH